MDEQNLRRILGEHGYYLAYTDYLHAKGTNVTRRYVAERKSDKIRRTLGRIDALSQKSEEEICQLLVAKFEEVPAR